MPDKPILVFPAATVAARNTLPQSFGPPGPRPTQAQQKQRLAGRFRALGDRFGTIQADTGGVDPEQVIVLETVGSIGDFQRVVKRIPGMEWLGDFNADIAEPDPGFLDDGTQSAQLTGRLFVVAGNRTAYTQLLKLWRQWTSAKDEKLPFGYGALAEVFKHLQDVRPWGPKDRVAATGVIAAWERGLASNEPTIRFETELWCRADAEKRTEALRHLQSVVTESGGQTIAQAAIPEIDYHGVLIELPAQAVRQAVDALSHDSDTKLLRLTDVKYFAPMGQAAVIPAGEGQPTPPPNRPLPENDPIAAILDGLPLANHAALQGRLIIDDPDGFATDYQPNEHRHGTAMASLIAHGEYDGSGPSLTSKIYSRPLMRPGRPDQNNRREERFPSEQLPVDLVHRAVRRMFEGDAGEEPQAPTVKVVNLSVGDASQLFDRHISPWARLLDWLAWKYQVLFVVSAGNHLLDLTIPAPPGSVAGMSDTDLRAHALRAMTSQKLHRRLLAPAESVNALTVGAAHSQTAPNGNAGRLVDLLRSAVLPSPINPVASGFRRAIKPEILVPGGRRHYSPKNQPSTATAAEFEISPVMLQPGQLVAAPGGVAVPPTHAVRVSGTSNSAALTTRRAVQFAEQIVELRQEPGGNVLTDPRMPVILKAMLVHGASWGDWQSFIDSVFVSTDNGMEHRWKIKRACAQFLGYGVADFDRAAICSDQRVVVLGSGELKAGDGHLYGIPLPPALNAQTVLRRLAITLAWLTPTNPRHRNYSIADLWFDAPRDELRISRTDAFAMMVKQGTVQHEVLEGEEAVAITAGDVMPIQVNCRADASSKLTVAVPYAVIVSLETARPLAVSIYDQVKVALDRLRAPIPVRASAGGRRSPR